MIFRNLTSGNDWTFGRGIQNFTKNQDAILLNAKTRLLSWVGDCFYATAEGVDYNNLLDVGTKNLLDSDIKRVILQSEGILRIDSFESSLGDDREYTGQATITTIFGVDELIF